MVKAFKEGPSKGRDKEKTEGGVIESRGRSGVLERGLHWPVLGQVNGGQREEGQKSPENDAQSLQENKEKGIIRKLNAKKYKSKFVQSLLMFF